MKSKLTILLLFVAVITDQLIEPSKQSDRDNEKLEKSARLKRILRSRRQASTSTSSGPKFSETQDDLAKLGQRMINLLHNAPAGLELPKPIEEYEMEIAKRAAAEDATRSERGRTYDKMHEFENLMKFRKEYKKNLKPSIMSSLKYLSKDNENSGEASTSGNKVQSKLSEEEIKKSYLEGTNFGKTQESESNQTKNSRKKGKGKGKRKGKGKQTEKGKGLEEEE